METLTNLSRGEKVDQQDFTATLDERGQWNATYSFRCWEADVVALTPLKGAECPKEGFSLLTAVSSTVTQEKGSAWPRVTVAYSGTSVDGSGEGGDEDIIPIYSLDNVANDEPIESHPNFKDLTDEDWLDIADFKKGLLVSKVVGETKEWKRKLFNKTTQKYTDEKPWTASTPEVTELIGYLDQGITHFKDPQAVWRMEYTSTNKISNSVLNNVGKIDTPQGDPPEAGEDRNWLLIGATMTSQGEIWDISLEWQMSGRGGWKETIYS